MKRSSLPQLLLSMALTSALLAACGGGDAGPPKNVAPVASAGTGQTVDAGTLIKLNGSYTDANQDLVSYTWTLTKPAGSMASLINPKVATPDFIADIAGTYTATLTVNDGELNSAPASVSFTAQVPVATFVALWDSSTCATSRRIYVADGHLVYTQQSSTICSDTNSASLYESTPARLLCTRGGLVSLPCSESTSDALMTSIQADIVHFLRNEPTVEHTIKQVYTYGP
ncbi:MAG TPA: PKD domain-containing protein [Burkholderiaceae bacterium]|nr:PKD domain-containing protein [Burkholderiaceae bacterium]